MLGNNSESKVYITTYKGKFSRKSLPSDDESIVITRTNKIDKVVKEVHFTSINASISKVSYKEGDYGKQLIVDMFDGEERYCLQTSVKSNLATTIINRLPNIDFTHPVDIKIGWNNEKERAWTALGQFGENLADFFSVWNEQTSSFDLFHDYPKWEKKKLNGEDVWDSFAQQQYQEAVVAKYAPAIEDAFNNATPINKEEPAMKDGKGVYDKPKELDTNDLVPEKEAPQPISSDKLPF